MNLWKNNERPNNKEKNRPLKQKNRVEIVEKEREDELSVQKLLVTKFKLNIR